MVFGGAGVVSGRKGVVSSRLQVLYFIYLYKSVRSGTERECRGGIRMYCCTGLDLAVLALPCCAASHSRKTSSTGSMEFRDSWYIRL